MAVTRDVILDLLPLYLANEVSADTRALVAEFLARDPELAEQVRRQRQADTGQPGLEVPPDLEVRTLRRLRRRLALREWSLGLAWFFTAISFGLEVSITSRGVREFHFMLVRYPAIFVPLLVVAIALWTLYFSIRRRARVSA